MILEKHVSANYRYPRIPDTLVYTYFQLNDYTDQTTTLFLLKFCIITMEFISSFFADGISLDKPLDNEDKTTKQEKDKNAELTRYHPMISCSFPCMLFRMWVLK